MSNIRSEFQAHLLNEQGIAKAKKIAQIFTTLLNEVEETSGKDGREMALVRTQLEQAAFFAKKAMAQRPENQIAPPPVEGT